MDKATKRQQKNEFESYYRDYEVDPDTTCGYSAFKGSFLQFSATKNMFIIVNGFASCLVTACFTYFSGSISSIEKLYGIPSQKSGIISVGNDITQVAVSLFVAFYLGDKHRPRWMAVGILCFAIYCFIGTLPHLIYGTGRDVLLLTQEFGEQSNSTAEFIALENQKTMCQVNGPAVRPEDCENPQNYMPQMILFIAQLIAGVGNAIYSSLSTAYLDDNVQKSKAPWVISVNHFIKMFGPALGFALASICLRIFIEPSKTPIITPEDPRWIGAWWIGMLALGVMCTGTAFTLSLFPKRMPRFVAKQAFEKRTVEEQSYMEMEKMVVEEDEKDEEDSTEDVIPKTMDDLWVATLRILKNKIFMLNVCGIIFYFYGAFPYWLFLAKYIEVQYRLSASQSNLYTGIVGLVFSALGILTSGVVLSKFKPSARKIVMWNVLTTLCTALIFFSYNSMGCAASDRATALTVMQINQNGTDLCNSNCHCDFVKYSPVCGEDGITYISPCHAGCREMSLLESGGIKGLSNCSCVQQVVEGEGRRQFGGSATPGACKVDCANWQSFYLFMAFKCLNNFLSATGISGSVLIGVRSVLREDKTFALGLKFFLTSLLVFIPSPIMFGWLMDKACIFWGKTACGENTNCWVYNGEMFRTNMNTIASSLMLVASLFNVAVWVFCKDLPIFHDDNEKVKSGKGDKVEANGQVDISRDSVLVKKGENLEVF